MNDKTLAKATALLSILGIDPHLSVGNKSRVEALASFLDSDSPPEQPEPVGAKGGAL